jgi:pyrroloquinoline-quinone synthase
MTWTTKIDEAVERKHLLKHPFYRAWEEGRLTREMLQRYAEQYYNHVAAFPRYLSAIHTQTADLKTRQYLLENLSDEEAGDRNHPELWLRFAEGLGLDRDAVRDATPLPETLEVDRRYRDIAGSRGPLAGLAALYAYESQIPAVATSKIEGLKTHYGIDDEATIDFFTTHIEADEWHAQVARDLLAVATPQEQGTALAAVEEALDALNLLLDGVWNAYCAEAAA